MDLWLPNESMAGRADDLRIAFAAIERRLSDVAHRDATSADRLYVLLRQAIAELILKPRDTLSEKDLAAVLGVSKTPVREALIRLAVEGLVVTLPRSGTFVAPIVPDDLFEAMVIRESLEGTAVRLAARKADSRAKFQLKQAMRRQMESVAAHDAAEFHRADDDLHRQIVMISGLRRLWSLLETVKVTLVRVRCFAAPVPGRIEMLATQHQAIVNAIVANNPDDAAVAMQAHLDALYPFVETLLRQHPEFFATASGKGPSRPRRASPEPASRIRVIR